MLGGWGRERLSRKSLNENSSYFELGIDVFLLCQHKVYNRFSASLTACTVSMETGITILLGCHLDRCIIDFGNIYA